MDSGLDSSSSAQAAAAPPSSSESDERRSEPQRQDAGKQGDSSSSRIDLTAAGLTKAATRSALSGGLSARAVLDLMLLPLRLIGLPSSLHPASLLPSILALGPVPEHIAFIMDGNRRFANASSMSIREGHMSGFEALKRILEACLKLQGVKCVTVYAFAIDNFKRDPGEVEALMHLAKTRLLEMSGHGEIITRHSVRVKVIGRRHLLPPDVRAAVQKVETMTKNHSRAVLNICMPYASRDEIAYAMRKSISTSLSSTNDPTASLPEITEDDIDREMMLADSPPLDILVRTSGVNRLSDFMLWQANEDTQLHFIDCYWPEFGWKELAPIILDYQRRKLAEYARDWVKGALSKS